MRFRLKLFWIICASTDVLCFICLRYLVFERIQQNTNAYYPHSFNFLVSPQNGSYFSEFCHFPSRFDCGWEWQRGWDYGKNILNCQFVMFHTSLSSKQIRKCDIIMYKLSSHGVFNIGRKPIFPASGLYLLFNKVSFNFSQRSLFPLEKIFWILIIFVFKIFQLTKKIQELFLVLAKKGTRKKCIRGSSFIFPA